MSSRHRERRYLGHHLTLHLEDWRVLARSPDSRHKLSASVRRVGRRLGVFLFRSSDNHLHVSALDDGIPVAEIGRCLAIGLHRALELPTPIRTKVTPIADQRHLYNLPPYFFGQERRHGTAMDPFHEGSCLPDLVGARVGAPWLRQRLLEVAPRLDIRALHGHLPPLGTTEDVLERGLGVLHTAAAAAVCHSRLRSLELLARAAKIAAIHLALDLGLGTVTEIADALNIARTTVWRSRTDAPDAAIRDAIHLQLRMRSVAPRDAAGCPRGLGLERARPVAALQTAPHHEPP